jgi:hypothetical protein
MTLWNHIIDSVTIVIISLTWIFSGCYGVRTLSPAVEIRQCIKIGEMILPKKFLHMFIFLLRDPPRFLVGRWTNKKFFRNESMDPSRKVLLAPERQCSWHVEFCEWSIFSVSLSYWLYSSSTHTVSVCYIFKYISRRAVFSWGVH